MNQCDAELQIALGSVSRWIRRLDNAKAKWEDPSALLSRADFLEQSGRAMAACGLPRGHLRCELVLWTEAGARSEWIELDPARTAKEQAKDRFAQAGKLRRTIERQRERATELERERSQALAWRERIITWTETPAAAPSRPTVERRLQDLRSMLLGRGLWPQPPGRATAPRPQKPVRWTFPDGWFLLAGLGNRKRLPDHPDRPAHRPLVPCRPCARRTCDSKVSRRQAHPAPRSVGGKSRRRSRLALASAPPGKGGSPLHPAQARPQAAEGTGGNGGDEPEPIHPGETRSPTSLPVVTGLVGRRPTEPRGDARLA